MNLRNVKIGLLIVGLATVAWYLSTGDAEVARTSASPDFSGWGFVIAVMIASIVLLVIAIWQREKILPALKKNSRFAFFTFFVVLCYVLWYALYPEWRERLLTPQAFGLLVLVIVAYCTFTIIKGMFWEENRFTALVMVAVLVILLGPGIMRNAPPEFSAWLNSPKWGSSSSASVVTTTAAVTPNCPGKAETRVYGSSLEPVNTKLCQLRGVVKQGCVSWFDVDRFLLTRSCEGNIPTEPSGIYYIQADTTAIVRFNYCRPFAPGNLLETCS